MYPVTQDFLDKMRADKRRVDAKITIDYTNWEIDQSIAVSAADQANVSYTQQTADGVAMATHKWASLDGSWILDGTWHLAPKPEDLAQFQFGWWSAQLAGTDGSFTSSYPTLTVTHIPRPVHTLRVVGDSARGEYPVDFTINLYAQDGTLLRSQNVAGNAAVEWTMVLPTPVLDVARQELVITRWSHPGRQAKILEFFTSIQETYYSGDVVEIRLLEEREASQGSLPVGNITSNEISVRLANEGKKFDVTNRNSPLAGLLKPNRRIRAWLGALAENQASEKPPTFSRNSVACLSNGQQVAANVPRFETVDGRIGVLVEEGTTNLLPNPRVDGTAGSTPMSFGVASGNSAVVSTNITDRDGNGKIAKHTRNPSQTGDSNCGYQSYNNAPANTTFTASVYVWIPSSANVDSIALRLEGPAYSGVPKLINADLTKRDQWQRITVSGPTNSSGGQIVVVLRISAPADGQYIYTDSWQLEQKAYSTSFVNGTRSPETLTIPTAGVLSPQEGTVEGWVYVDDVSKFTNNLWQLFDVNRAGGGDDALSLYHQAGGTMLRFKTTDDSNNASYLDLNISSRLTVGWHYYAARWDGTTKWVTWDELSATQTGARMPSVLDTHLDIGCDTSPAGAYLNSLIDSLRVSSRARTDQEIAAAYAAGKLEKDDNTTYLLTFNGSIYPVEQVWVPLGTFWSLDWDSPDDTLEASVTARDRLELLRKSTYTPGQVQQNISLYTLAEQVLLNAGLKPGEYAIDTALQSIIVPWAWLSPTSHREALRIIAEAALAVVYADRDGVICVESMGSVPPTPVLEITENDYFPPLQAPSRQDQVANEIVVTTQPLRPADTPQEVYRSSTPISIPAGQTVTVTSKYGQPPVVEAVVSLDAPPAGVSIVSTTYYAWGAEVSIRNTGGSTANVTLVINGKPLSVQGGEQVVARDEMSIVENSVLRYEFPTNPLVQTLTQAQAIAQALLASAKDPRRDLELEWRGNPALELGDRVTVVGQDVHAIRQEIKWAGALGSRLTGRKVTG